MGKVRWKTPWSTGDFAKFLGTTSGFRSGPLTPVGIGRKVSPVRESDTPPEVEDGGSGGRKAHSSPSASSDGNEGGPPGPTGEPDAAKVGGFPAGGPVTDSGAPRSTRIRRPLQGRPTRLSAGQRCHHERGPEELGRLRPTGYSGPRRVPNALGRVRSVLERRRPGAQMSLRRCRPTGWGGGAPMPPGTRGSRGPSAGPADG